MQQEREKLLLGRQMGTQVRFLFAKRVKVYMIL